MCYKACIYNRSDALSTCSAARTVGSHDGTVANWGGGKYHVEYAVDHDKQEGTVYVLDDDEKTPSPIQAESIQLSINDPAMQVTLEAAPQEDDPAGSASGFVGNHESLGVVQEYAGTITGVVDGTPYSGDFNEEPHGQGGHTHTHGADDGLVWDGEPRNHAGLEIKLGHHGKQLHAGKEVEPAASISRNGQLVSDAEVFNALVSADGETVLAAEVATVYEPTTAEEPAHYAQGALAIPKNVDTVIIRFRIAPAEGDAVTFDVPITLDWAESLVPTAGRSMILGADASHRRLRAHDCRMPERARTRTCVSAHRSSTVDERVIPCAIVRKIDHAAKPQTLSALPGVRLATLLAAGLLSVLPLGAITGTSTHPGSDLPWGCCHRGSSVRVLF